MIEEDGNKFSKVKQKDQQKSIFKDFQKIESITQKKKKK